MLDRNRKRQQLLNQLLMLRYSAVAVKLIEDETQVPPEAVRPMENMGKHIALCQAFALARRQGKLVYMRKQDHWCWNPLITYGMVDNEKGSPAFREISRVMGISDPEKADAFVDGFPKLPRNQYCGILTAPLDCADFEPDVLLIYCSNSQLRLMLMAVNSQTGQMLDSSFTPLDSCVYSVIPPLMEGNYRITLPDPGEYERALADEHDIIFSVPFQRMEEFFTGVELQYDSGKTLNSFYPMMKEDFSRPPFYNTLFTMWGLDTGEDWDKPAKTKP